MYPFSQYIVIMRDWMKTSGALDAISLLVLTDLEIIAKWTLMRGKPKYRDSLAIIPGMHQQMTAPDMSKGEYPACAAMTTGYVFRVENSATVHYLQSVGRPGQLTVLKVGDGSKNAASVVGIVADLVYAITTSSLWLLLSQDLIAALAVFIMVMARLLLTFTIRRRAKLGWFGAPEPGVLSDLLVLLSQDRWVRIQGPTDDVKAITSGSWLSEPTWLERSCGGLAKYMIFLGAALFTAAKSESKFVFFVTLCINTLNAHVVNECTDTFTMHGIKLYVSGERIKYKRRLDMVKELVATFDRTDCFVAMGMIQPRQAEELRRQVSKQDNLKSDSAGSYDKKVIM